MRTSWRRSAGPLGVLLAVMAVLVSYNSLRSGERTKDLPIAKTSLDAPKPTVPAELEPVDTTPPGPLVVHEWGTFTNFAGADGVQLDFRPNVSNELPEFVFDRWWQVQSPFGKAYRKARLRMETPVTYFYTDGPRNVDVKVQFPQGLLTEFYPPVKSFGPAYQSDQPAAMKDSFLDWGSVRLITPRTFAKMRWPGPNDTTMPMTLPAVTGDDHYGFARETDSAVVETRDQFHSRHFEKFLFYRGLGTLKLPLTLSAQSAGHFLVTNSGADDVGTMFLVQINDGQVRFTQAAHVAGNDSLSLELPTQDSTIDTLAEQMRQALVETGLYDKEARAMVKTWRSSWFGEDGARLLYLVPRRLTDEVLPLTISPTPDEMVRVLVGRIEVMTPEREQQLHATISSLGTCLSITSEPLRSELRQLGRFAEPALDRIVVTAADPDFRRTAGQLLAELRQREIQVEH